MSTGATNAAWNAKIATANRHAKAAAKQTAVNAANALTRDANANAARIATRMISAAAATAVMDAAGKGMADMLPARLLWWLLVDRPRIDGDRLNVPDNRGTLIFRDNGADVLLVAHVDHIAEPDLIVPRTRGMVVRHPGLDDRLGCWGV